MGTIFTALICRRVAAVSLRRGAGRSGWMVDITPVTVIPSGRHSAVNPRSPHWGGGYSKPLLVFLRYIINQCRFRPKFDKTIHYLPRVALRTERESTPLSGPCRRPGERRRGEGGVTLPPAAAAWLRAGDHRPLIPAAGFSPAARSPAEP